MKNSMIYLCVSPEGNLELWYECGIFRGWEVERDKSDYIEYFHFGPEDHYRTVLETWEE